MSDQRISFVAKGTYRKRRLRDAARMLPVLGLFFVMVPLFWSGRSEPADTGVAGIYLFLVWLVLIGLTALLAPRLEEEAPGDTEDTGQRGADGLF